LQAYLLITKSADGGGRYNTPPSLMLAAWQAYKAAQEASLAAPATELVQVSTHPYKQSTIACESNHFQKWGARGTVICLTRA
jgi:hypothetical protein